MSVDSRLQSKRVQRSKTVILVRNNAFLRMIYRIVFNALITAMKCIVRIDEKKILFVCFGGRSKADNVGPVYEAMLNDKRYDGYTLVWAFTKPESMPIVGRGQKVKIDSLRYYQQALSARIWITNSSVERSLKLRRKETLYFMTNHGVPIKTAGLNVASSAKGGNTHHLQFTAAFTQGKYDQKIYAEAYELPIENVYITGQPRNDYLARITQADLKRIKDLLGIPLDRKVILYAPTFRDYQVDSHGFFFDLRMNLSQWEKMLGSEYVLLVRLHGAINRRPSIAWNHFVKDATDFESIEELLAISDALISDYSSVFYDFALLKRPIFCYAYDYDMYEQARGFSEDLKNLLPCEIFSEEAPLLQAIATMDYDAKVREVTEFPAFREQMIGEASQRVCDIIYQYLNP